MKLRICHLYGNLLNTYGDNGNLLMLQYLARQKGLEVETTLVSLKEPFIADDFDLIEQTYQDILKKAGQELVEEDDETVS